jgi:predicted CoA-substrate-specific enzyme activase
MITAGIDSGSRTVKAALFDTEARVVVASGERDQPPAHTDAAAALFADLLDETGLARPDVSRVVATGYARDLVRVADRTATEITCHARGVRFHVPGALGIVEIGGQDSKVIRLDEAGRVAEFAMNDRCAAGTGRFLETVAARLGVEVAELAALAAASEAPAAISSTCVVFAESEIVGHLAGGAEAGDLVAGVMLAIARRVAAMGTGPLPEPGVFTGGVARCPAMTEALAAVLGHPLRVPPAPSLTGALGAALLAAE